MNIKMMKNVSCQSNPSIVTITLFQTSPEFLHFENTVRKGEIALNEQFILFPQCFIPDMNNFLQFQPITSGQNFRLVQIGTNCRRHFEMQLKCKISTIKGRKHCEKRRNCLL